MRVRVSAVLLVCSMCLRGQDLTKYRVSVRLTANDELRDVLKSAFERRFRGLNDVALVSKSPQFILRVTGIQTRARRGSKFRLILAYSFSAGYAGALAPLLAPN